MRFDKELIQGRFLKRYKRFFADFELEGKVETAHCPNTGSLKSCNDTGSQCWVTKSDDPNRKLKFTLEMIQASSGALVGVNTGTPNKIVKESLEAQLFNHWKGFDQVKPEFKLNKETRLDFALTNSQTGKQHFIEVKNVTLKVGDSAQFPDAVTERGQKHLKELMALMELGHSCEILFTVQRNDVEVFSPADDIDPEYGKLLREAHYKGLRVTPVIIDISMSEIKLSEKILPLKL